jgi:large subunit ribosomal protein L21
MNVLAVLVLGLLIGWLAEWVIDWFYWRSRIRPVAEENANLKEKIKSLEARKNKRSQQSRTKPIRDRAGRDNLQAIKGIGPVISKRLNDAGVYTFEELAQLTPDELEEILGALIKRFFPGEDNMIAQAKEFASQKAQQA